MKHMMLFLAMMLLLPVAMIGAGDEDSLPSDADAVIDSGVNFDIPEEATKWREGREKESCTCRTEQAAYDTWCDERPMYYLIKVQNWGDDTAHDVVVIDDLDPRVDYIPDTTEMATQFDEKGDGTDWTSLPDGANGEIPLAGEGYKVADMMTPCDIGTLTCADTRLLRFKVMPKKLPLNEIIPNQSTIKEATGEYLTNGGPLKLKGTWNSSDCQEHATCPEPPKSECGGGGESDVDTMPDVDESVVDKAETEADFIMPKDDGCGCSVVW